MLTHGNRRRTFSRSPARVCAGGRNRSPETARCIRRLGGPSCRRKPYTCRTNHTLSVWIVLRFDEDAYGNLLNMAASAAATSLLYSGEFTDPSGQQYLRARYYDPTTGRFNRLDPFAGNIQDPQSLHKYLYVHGDPIQGIDPSGLVSISSTLGSTSVGGLLRNINQSSIVGAINAVEKVFDFIDAFTFFRDLLKAVDSSQFVLSHLEQLKSNIGKQAGIGKSKTDFAKLRGLESAHISEVARQLVIDAPEILPKIGKEHRELIKKVGLKVNGKNRRTRPTLVIGLPSLPGNYTGSKFLTHSGTIGGFRLGFAVPDNGRGGSVFSIGFKFANSNTIHQIFRLDYHGQGFPKETTGVPSHGRAYVLGGDHNGQPRGLGPSIPGVGAPVFHYHVPFSKF